MSAAIKCITRNLRLKREKYTTSRLYLIDLKVLEQSDGRIFPQFAKVSVTSILNKNNYSEVSHQERPVK